MVFIKRDLLNELRDHLPKKELSLIIGARQVGKTTLMHLLKKELEDGGEETLFLSLDFERDKQFFTSQDKLIKKIELELGGETGEGRLGYVFIDEIQRKENAGIFLKGLCDMKLPYKFIVSGSGSLELKEKIHESLIGRKRVFELNPVSFTEFVNFKTSYRYENRLNKFFTVDREKTENLLWEYLNFGGYPRVVSEEKIEEKRRHMDEILHSYLEKDISHLLRVERVDAFSSLIKILASQVGRLINYSELSLTAGISMQTLKNYIWYAEKTFIIKRLTPYHTNPRKEITKSPVAYFHDMGLRNYSLGLFGNLTRPYEMGHVFENFVFNILKEEIRFSGATLHFWRTKDKAEVDFLINFGTHILPIEVKYRRFTKPTISRSLRSFIRKYNPKKAVIVNKDFRKQLRIGETELIYLPYHELFMHLSNLCQNQTDPESKDQP